MEWIRVEDRLPEKKEGHEETTEKLFAVTDGMSITVAWFVFDLSKFGAKGGIYSKVTHWMPLPEPPNEINQA